MSYVMPNEPPRVYWDSCVYISCIQSDVGRRDVLDRVIAQAENGDIVLIASAMVVAEVTKIEGLSDSIAEQARKIQKFFLNDYIKVRAVDRHIAQAAAEISRCHRIKPPDAVHVATALEWKCVSFQTYDGEKPNRRKLLPFDGKIGTPPLRIELPRVLSDDQSGRQPLLDNF